MPFSRLSRTRYDYVQGSEATKLHTVDVWLPRPDANPDPVKRWIVFIHGGAWRDPEIDSMALAPAVEILSALPLNESIAGFASINHRLSPYPDHPTDPSAPDDRSRNAKHPDHLIDVSNALVFLEMKYGISSGFLLVGHSAGATLAFLIQKNFGDFNTPTPSGVLGVEGIYDIPELVRAYEKIPIYREFVENAFGSDEFVWRNASPASSENPAAWGKAKAIIIAHSDEDELISNLQADLMMKRLHRSSYFRDKSYYMHATGHHDAIWKEGYELARLIENALAIM